MKSLKMTAALLLFYPVLAFSLSQDKPGTKAAASETKRPCSPIALGGINVICLSQGIGAITQSERAQLVQQRLDDLSKDVSFDPNSIVVSKPDPESVEISGGTAVILSLKDGDVDGLVNEDLLIYGTEVAQRMRASITADRLIRRPQAIIVGIMKSLGATLALILLLFVFKKGFAQLHIRLAASKGRFIRSIKIQTFEILNASRILAFLHWLLNFLRFVLILLALYVYFPLVLSFFPWTMGWSDKLLSYIITPFVTTINVFTGYIPNIFFIAAIIVVTRYLLKVIYFFFSEIAQGNLQFEGFYKDWAEPTYKLVRVIVIAFAFVMVFPYLPGSSSPAFQGVSVFLGLLLSFGSSSAIANIIAGIVLTYMRPFRIGDRVKISETIGDVLEKNLLVTRIRSIKHVEITIPNSMVLGSHIVNYSAAASREGLILNTTVTIGYDAPWKKVHQLLIEAAHRTPKIDTTRKSFVLQTALNDFYVSYELNVYTSFPNEMASIYSELHSHIQDCFNEAGVEIMSPHYSALRDGNEPAVPDSFRGDLPPMTGFRFRKD